MNKKKNTLKKILLFIIIILIICLAIFMGYNYFNKDNDDNEVKIIRSIPTYDYSLKDNKTKLYNDTFEELSDILNEEDVSYEEYAKCISKLFIIDFYTLNNKSSKNDVGGTDFIYPDMVDNFVEEARSTFYRYIQTNTGENKNDNLPEVSNIDEVFVEETTFTLKELKQTVDAYKVTIKWSYKEETDYENEAKVILIKKDKKLYIVEMD